MGLIPEEILLESQRRYYELHPTPAMLTVRTLKAKPDMTTAELALIVGRSRGWVRKVLRQAGLTAARVRKETKRNDP
jgi:hypothetical protein